MSATLSAGVDSLVLNIKTPMESDGVTPRDDLVGVKVWYSTTNNFTPPGVGTLAYDGNGLDITIPGLNSGTLYYVRYALISEIEPDYYTLSTQLSGTPVYETQTVDTTAPPTPTGVVVTAGVGSIFIKHDAPTYTMGRGHKKTHVFGLKTTDVNNAAGYTFARAAAAGEIGQFTGNFYNFSSDPATEWHIWLKWETNNGVLSDVASGGTTGNTATTSQDVSTLLSALTSKITTDQLTTSLSNSVGTISNLNNQYAVKINTSGQIAGFGLAGTTSDSGQATSEFGIQASTFWIAPAPLVLAAAPTVNLFRGKIWVDTSVPATPVTKYWTGNAWSTTRETVLPFTVITEPTSAGGQTVNPGVYMDAVFIKDGTITNAKIGDATITYAKIGSVDASKITVGKLTATQIDSTGLSIKDSAGNILLDASNSQLGVSLYVGTGSNKRLLSTVGAFAATPNTAYIGEFSSAPTITTSGSFNSWDRSNAVATVYTNEAHNLVLGSKVSLAGNGNLGVGSYEIIDIVNTTTFKIVNAGVNDSGTSGTYSGYRLAENSVYKNTTNGNTYILTGSTLAWTIFLQNGQSVKLQYSADNSSWHDAYASGDLYVRSGTLAPGATTYTYGTSTKFIPVKGTDYVDGTSVKLQYSTDNSNWHDTYAAGDLYIRSGSKASGAADYTWQTSTKFVPVKGTDYYDGVSASIQYSTDNTNWHDTYASGDIYIRTGTKASGATSFTYGTGSKYIPQKGVEYKDGTDGKTAYFHIKYSNDGGANFTGNSGEDAGTYIGTYSDNTEADSTSVGSYTWVKIKGDKGADSTVAGPRGSTWAYISGQTTWSSTVANTYFTNNFADIKVINDTVTEYGTNFSETRVWNGSSWIKVAVAIDGNLLVKGTVTADAVATGTVIVGSVVKSSDEKFIIDFANKYISITV
jgi:hypothetical protein